MTTVAVAFICAVLVSALLTPAIRAAARRYGFLDHALSSRKAHGKPIPRLGGVAIVAGFFAPLLGLLVVDSGVGRLFTASRTHVVGLFVGGAAIAALGLFDDLKGSGAKLKFAVQFGVAGLVYALGFRVETLAVPLLGVVELGWLGLPLTLLWVVGVVNALNLIDGLDGLAGGVAFIAIATTFIVAAGHGDALMMLFTAALGGAVLGFLFFNFNPASIFMGDTGSLFLGFVLATTSLETHQKSSAAVALLVPVVVLGLPIGDTLLSMARRKLRGVPMFAADRGHIHHRLLARGLSHRQTVLVLYAFATLLGLVALVLSTARDPEAVCALALLGLVAFAALRALGFFDLARMSEILEQRRRNRALRARVDGIAARLRHAAEPAAVWETLVEEAPGLGAHPVRLEVLCPRNGRLSYASPIPSRMGEVLRARYAIGRERSSDHVLELAWADRQSVDRDTEIAVEHLCQHLSSTLGRVHGADNVISLDLVKRGLQGVLRRQRGAAAE